MVRGGREVAELVGQAAQGEVGQLEELLLIVAAGGIADQGLEDAEGILEALLRHQRGAGDVLGLERVLPLGRNAAEDGGAADGIAHEEEGLALGVEQAFGGRVGIDGLGELAQVVDAVELGRDFDEEGGGQLRFDPGGPQGLEMAACGLVVLLVEERNTQQLDGLEVTLVALEPGILDEAGQQEGALFVVLQVEVDLCIDEPLLRDELEPLRLQLADILPELLEEPLGLLELQLGLAQERAARLGPRPRAQAQQEAQRQECYRRRSHSSSAFFSPVSFDRFSLSNLYWLTTNFTAGRSSRE